MPLHLHAATLHLHLHAATLHLPLHAATLHLHLHLPPLAKSARLHRAPGLAIRGSRQEPSRVGAGGPRRCCAWMVAWRVPRAPAGAMAIIFLKWRMLVSEVKTKLLEDQLTRARRLIGKRADSIWLMNKSELARVAEEELNISMATAEGMRVAELRLAIKENREDERTYKPQVPKGLSRMVKEDLRTEAERCGIALVDPRNGKEKPREKLMIEIRQRYQLMTQEAEQSSTTSQMGMDLDPTEEEEAAFPDAQTDFETVNQPGLDEMSRAFGDGPATSSGGASRAREAERAAPPEPFGPSPGAARSPPLSGAAEPAPASRAPGRRRRT